MRRTVAVLVLAFAGCVPQTTSPSATPVPVTPEPSQTAAPTLPPASPTASASPGARPSLDARYGWVAPVPPANFTVKIRRETEARALSTLDAYDVAVSPDGRILAYWTPAGTRRELRVAPAAGGADRVLLRLPEDEIGNAHAWSTDGTGIVVQVDSSRIAGGGIDPPPLYTSVRTIDVASGATKEVVRRNETRLTPIGWQRSRAVIPAYTGSPEGGIQTYHRITESGSALSWPLTSDLCVTGTVMRLDADGARVLSAHPVRCFDVQPGAPPRVPTLRVWPVDDGDAVTEIEFPGGAWILDARFRPRSQEIGVSTVTAGSLKVEIVSGTSKRELASVDTPGGDLLGAQFAPLVFRPEGDVALVVVPRGAGRTVNGRLVDIASGASTDVDLASDMPSWSVLLGTP